MAKIVVESVWTDRKEAAIEAYKMISNCCVQDELPKKRDISALTDKIKKMEQKIDGLIDMRAEGEITKEEYGHKRDQLDIQLKSFKTEMSDLENVKVDKEDAGKKLDAVKQALDECIDFSSYKISDDVIDQFIKMVKPKNNSMFQWYLDLFDKYGDPLICGIEGNKKHPILVDRYKNHLPINQYRTSRSK